MSIVKNFADKLFVERMERNWSLMDLSKKSNIAKSILHRYEKGVKPRLNNLEKLAKAFNLPIETLIFPVVNKKTAGYDWGYMDRIQMVVDEYRKLADPLVTKELFEEWLTGLSPSLRRFFKVEGYDKSKSNPLYIRYVMERNDYGWVEFMKTRLPGHEYEYWHAFSRINKASKKD